MKKHLLGLGIFSFIVVLFAVAFGFFYVKKINKVENPRTPVIETDKRKSCDYSKKRNIDSSCKFTQATLQKNNRQFNALIDCENLSKDYSLELNFFINDGKKTELIATEISKVKKVYIDGKGYWEVETKLREWLSDYDRKNNFYVMSNLDFDGSVRFSDDELKFDANKAVSVMWIESPVIEKNLKSRKDPTKILQ